MIYQLPQLQAGKFLKRMNRFGVMIQGDEKEHYIHLLNSGRLRELLIPGTSVGWIARDKPGKTEGSLYLVEHKNEKVILVSTIANKLFESAFKAGLLTEFSSKYELQAEVKIGKSRLDFCLSHPEDKEKVWIEVKSVTLNQDGVARFPDAPTERGVKHLNELIALKEQGHRAAVVFMILRGDVNSFEPNDMTHPEFGDTLRQAISIGVECYAYQSTWNWEGCKKIEAVPCNILK